MGDADGSLRLSKGVVPLVVLQKTVFKLLAAHLWKQEWGSRLPAKIFISFNTSASILLY